MTAVINRLAYGRLAAAVRRVAVSHAMTNHAVWLTAMLAAQRPPAEVLGAYVAGQSIVSAFWTMRPERLIDEYGHLLRG